MCQIQAWVLFSIQQEKLVQLRVEFELSVQQSTDVKGEHGCPRWRCPWALTAVDIKTRLKSQM